MANRLQTLDVDLRNCYKEDLNWALLPQELEKVSWLFTAMCPSSFNPPNRFKSHNHAFHPLCFKICALLGKGMKQRPTTVLLGIISMISFCLGHASLEVHQFWKEAIISWIAIVLPTGANATYNPCLRFTLRVRRWGGPSNALGALLPHFLGKTPCTILHG